MLSLLLASSSMYLLLFFSSSTALIVIVIFLYASFNGLLSNATNLVNVLVARNIDKQYHSTGISIIDLIGKCTGGIALFVVIPFISSANIFWIWLSFALLCFSQCWRSSYICYMHVLFLPMKVMILFANFILVELS